MARKPVDPYAAAATPVSSVHKAEQAAARRRRKKLEERTRKEIAARKYADAKRGAAIRAADREILVAEHTPSLWDITANLKPPPKKPKGKGAKEKPLSGREMDALRLLRLIAARRKPVDFESWKTLRDTRPENLRPVLEPQPGKTVRMRDPGEPERPSMAMELKAKRGDKDAKRKVDNWQQYWRTRIQKGPLDDEDLYYLQTSGLPSGGKILRPIASNIETIGREAIPAAMAFGGAVKHDALHPKAVTPGEMADEIRTYAELAKWAVSDKNVRNQPITESHLTNLLGQMIQGWQVGLRKAVPKPWDPEDLAEAREYWSEDPLFAFMDVFPFGALVTRPLSAARLATRIGRTQEGTGPLTALGRGIRESYRPGTEARAGRAGGIEPRVARATIGDSIIEEMGRPWSRTPIIRGLQGGYDRATEHFPSVATHRVARLQERRQREDVRRVQLKARQLSKPISDFTFTRLGRFKGAFGPRSNMTRRERSYATALTYALQLPMELDVLTGLRAVRQDKLDLIDQGKFDLADGKQAKLDPGELQNLKREVEDIDRFLKDAADDSKLVPEMREALEALKGIADESEDLGLGIMERLHGGDAALEIQGKWGSRASSVIRRLQSRGLIGQIDVPEREARLAELTKLFGREKANALLVASDGIAYRNFPHDPGEFYRRRIGMPEEMTAAEFTGEALFQGPGRRQILDPDGGFHSNLQKGLDDPSVPETQTVEQWRATVSDLTKNEEIYNSGLFTWFDSLPPGTKIRKAEIQEHLSSYLNDYNLEEYYLVSGAGEIDGVSYETRFDKDIFGGALVSRYGTPGEYREIVMRLPGHRGRDIPYQGKGRYHWQAGPSRWPGGIEDADNVVVHLRFQIFEENGVRKLLVEEIQSDWASEFRAQRRLLRFTGIDEAKIAPEWEMSDADLARRQLQKKELADLDLKLWEVHDELYVVENELRRGGEDIDREPLLAEQADLAKAEQQLQNEINVLANEIGSPELAFPPAPLRDKYYRLAVRRIAREAVDENVDEIMFVDRRTQHVRNDETGRIRLDALKSPRKQEFPISETSFQMYERDFPDQLAKEYGAAREFREDAYWGRMSTQSGQHSGSGQMGATVIPVNDTMRIKVADSQAFYQKVPDYDALPRGATELLADGDTAIRLFERADPSTWIHELGHVALHDLPADDLAIIEKTLAGGRKLEDWTTSDHERFARSFETYVQKGYTPVETLKPVFQKLKGWIADVWRVTGQKAENIPDEARAVFDRMFSEGPAQGKPWAYFPHREFWDMAQSEYRGPVRKAAAGEAIGDPQLNRKTIERGPNELIRYQTGNLSPDPAQLMDVYLNRIRYGVTLGERDDIYWNIAVPYDEVGETKGGWLIREPGRAPAGRAPGKISPEMREGVRRGKEAQREALKAQDDLDIPEEDIFGGTYEKFRDEIMAKVDDSPYWRKEEGVRWVPGNYINTRLGDAFDSKPRGWAWNGLGLLNSLQRTASIYGKPISYILGNIPFNVLALLLQQPMSLFHDLPAVLKMRVAEGPHGKELFQRLASESGETKASSGLPRFYTRATGKMQRWEERASGIQRGLAEALSEIADDPFRVTAMVRNARKRGYKTDADLVRLLDAETPQTKRDLHEVRQVTREQMLDFDALNPTQRTIASQALFLWPFIYASAKWPVMFAREYPGRAGGIVELMQQQEEKKGKKSEIPQQIANLIKTRFGAVDAATINPASPLADIAEGVQALIHGGTSADLSVVRDRLAPTLGALADGLGGGKKGLLLNLLQTTVPGAAEVTTSIWPSERGGMIYGPDRDLLDYLLQRHIRFWPRDTNNQVITERIEQYRKDRSSIATFDREKQDDWKKLRRYVKAIGDYDDDDIAEVTRSYRSWWDYQEATAQMKEDTGQRNLTPVQRMEILDEIVRENFPEMEDELWDVNNWRDEAVQKKYADQLEEYLEGLKAAINSGRDMVHNDYRSETAEDTY